MADLTDTITAAAAAPLEAETPAGRARQQSLADLVEADRYLKALGAQTSPRRGLRFTRLIPPGTLPDPPPP